MAIDYTKKASTTEPPPKISLTKGQRVSLTKQAGPQGLGQAVVACGWDASKRGHTFDLDLVAIGLDSRGRLVKKDWFVWYRNLRAPGNAIQHTGDNLTGAGDGDDESLIFNFPDIPSSVQSVVLAVNIYQAESKDQYFSDVKNAFVRIYDRATQRELLRYDLGSNFGKFAVMVFGELYREGNEWQFRAVGEGTSQRDLRRKYDLPSF
jgi:tellurium resistance protein TerD